MGCGQQLSALLSIRRSVNKPENTNNQRKKMSSSRCWSGHWSSSETALMNSAQAREVTDLLRGQNGNLALILWGREGRWIAWMAWNMALGGIIGSGAFWMGCGQRLAGVGWMAKYDGWQLLIPSYSILGLVNINAPDNMGE